MIKASCSNCGKTFNAPDGYAGKKAKCPNCNQHLEIAPIEKTGKDQSRSIIAAAVAAAVGTAIPAFVLGVLLGVFAFSPNNRDKSVSTPVHLNRNQDTPERIAEKPEILEQMTPQQISQKWDEIRKATPPSKTNEQIRQEKIERQFSLWDGSHKNLTRLIKESLHDNKSYRHEKTHYIDNGFVLIVVTKFRAKNILGATVLNTARAEVDLDDNIIWWEVD